MGEITFNGKSTSGMGVVIQSPPVYEFPSPDIEIVKVEGRSGDIILHKGSYQNVRRTYNVASIFGSDDFITKARELVDWLTTIKGYSRLEDSYEPLYFRMAAFRNSGELRNIYDKATVLQLVFDCKPQRYLKSGETPIVIDSFGSFIKIVNPTKFIALPIITLDNIAENSITIEVVSGEDHDNPDNYTKVVANFVGQGGIDSDLQDCFNSSEFLNEHVELSNGFPKLYPGDNWLKVVHTSGPPTSLTITPRWWTL